jgi:hypothetical protein
MIGVPFIAPVIQVNTSKTFTVYGKSFFRVSGVYLSGSDGVYENTTFFDPFSASPKLSSYGGFFGVQLSAGLYQSNNNNELKFTTIPAICSGYVDVILQNEAGWGALTQFVVKSTQNPYTSGSFEYNNYTPYQRPWKDGLIVNSTTTSLSYLSAGTLMLTSCNGFDLEGIYADGVGGSYTSIIETSSTVCGFTLSS